MRQTLLRVHRWAGLIAGVYVLVISITGAALVFRIDLQRALHPHLFTALAAGALADPVTIMESVSRAYPGHNLSGVDAPTTARPTYLAYVTTPGQFATVLIDPVSAEVLGELPENSVVRTLQDLHYDLLAGRTGRTVNGAGAAAILVMAITGVCIWWPGVKTWRRAMTIDFSRRGHWFWWEMHRAIGIWSVLLILMWAITGMYFAFPSFARSLITSVSPLTPNRTPASSASMARATAPSWREMIAIAQREHPGGHVARVVLPFGDRGAFLVMFADRSPTPAFAQLDSVYLDRLSGARLRTDLTPPTIGDTIVRSIAPLHVGSFGGLPIRMIWFVFGLMPAALFGTGVVVWWNRQRLLAAPPAGRDVLKGFVKLD
jgi:uncharacterized iron-regulated membrane protein